MSDQIVEPTEPTIEVPAEIELPDELATLKKRATTLGIRFHPKIGLDKLKAKVDVWVVEQAKKTVKTDAKATPTQSTSHGPITPQTASQARQAAYRKATKLSRVRVTCMNPSKKEWEGEIFTASNSIIGTIKKYVPFNAENGWHVPSIILQIMREREFQQFSNRKDGRGRVGKLVREFAIEEMPSLTPLEMKDLANQQAIAAGAE